MITVRITLEQDEISDATPQTLEFRYEKDMFGGNPRFAADAMQTAVVRAAEGACAYLAHSLDLRDGEVALDAVETLMAVVAGLQPAEALVAAKMAAEEV